MLGGVWMVLEAVVYTHLTVAMHLRVGMCCGGWLYVVDNGWRVGGCGVFCWVWCLWLVFTVAVVIRWLIMGVTFVAVMFVVVYGVCGRCCRGRHDLVAYGCHFGCCAVCGCVWFVSLVSSLSRVLTFLFI